MPDPDADVWLAPIMTGIPAVISEAEGALSNFPDGFAGIMIGAQHVANHGPMMTIGVLEKSGRFVAGTTTRDHAVRLRELLDLVIEGIDRGDFDKPVVAS